MRALSITIDSKLPTTLPIAYNELIQGLLYGCWRDSFPQLHDEGFSANKDMRLFTFGPLRGNTIADGKTKTIRLNGPVHFEVRSPIEELLNELASQLSERDHLRIGQHEYDLVNLQCCDRLLFKDRCVIHATSAVVVHTKLDDGHTHYYSPEEPDWLRLIQKNMATKAELFSLDADTAFAIMPKTETLRKRVTKFKGTIIIGWQGDFLAFGSPSILSMLYYTGLGAKNSQGFGMFDICDERI